MYSSDSFRPPHLKSLTSDLFAAVDVDNLVLINELKNMRSVHEDANSSYRGDQEEDPELGPVDNHRHELPIFSDLKWSIPLLSSSSTLLCCSGSSIFILLLKGLESLPGKLFKSK